MIGAQRQSRGLGSVRASEMFRIKLHVLTETIEGVGDDYSKRLDAYKQRGANNLYSKCDIVDIHRPLIRPEWRGKP